MRVSFSINAFGPGANQATEIKEKLEAVLLECGLHGETKGMGYEQFATYYANFTNDVKRVVTETPAQVETEDDSDPKSESESETL
mgnify:CR=1 FL=1